MDCPTEAHPHLWRAATIAVGAVMFADAMTTAYAIGSGKGAELNPILAPLANHPTAFGLVKGGLSVSAILTVFKLHQDPAKRTQALSLLAIQGAVSSLAVISNQRHLSESRP